MGDRQINIVDILSKELLVLFEIEEAHIHELAKSCFGSVRKVRILLAFQFHAILDFSQILGLVLDARHLVCHHILIFMNLRLKNFVTDIFQKEQLGGQLG